MNNLPPFGEPVQPGLFGPSPITPPSAAEGPTSKPILVEYLHIIRRRKWWILGVIALAFMLALVATLLMRPVYTAVTQIEVSREQKNVTNVEGVDSEQVGRDLEFYILNSEC